MTNSHPSSLHKKGTVSNRVSWLRHAVFPFASCVSAHPDPKPRNVSTIQHCHHLSSISSLPHVAVLCNSLRSSSIIIVFVIYGLAVVHGTKKLERSGVDLEKSGRRTKINTRPPKPTLVGTLATTRPHHFTLSFHILTTFPSRASVRARSNWPDCIVL